VISGAAEPGGKEELPRPRESSRRFSYAKRRCVTEPCGKDDGIPATKARVARGRPVRRI
jgi:hypothetical protein